MPDPDCCVLPAASWSQRRMRPGEGIACGGLCVNMDPDCCVLAGGSGRTCVVRRRALH